MVLVDADSAIESRDARTGDVRQVYEIPSGFDFHHVEAGDRAILRQGRTLKALNLESGRMEWERPLLDEMRARLTTTFNLEGVRMVVGSRPDMLVACYDGATVGISADDGAIRWAVPAWSPQSEPAVAAGRVYTMCVDRLTAIDELSGEIIYDVHHPELASIAGRDKTGTIYNGRIAIASELGPLSIFDLATGELVSLQRLKVPLWQTAEIDGQLFVATGAGTVLVFDESIWSR
jgi:outer membrane protein assembly factor BamB